MEENTRSQGLSERRRRNLRRLSNLLLTVMVIAGAYPWATGAYTWLQQQRMLSGFGMQSPPEGDGGASSAHLFQDPDMTGWEAEDGAYWASLTPGQPFARIAIPRIDVDVMAVKGVSREDLKLGPGWLSDTARPGEMGNVGMSGHRTTFLAPFRRLDRVTIGDRIELRSPYRLYVYRVVQEWTVLPEEGHVMRPTEEAMLTLTTCHPPFSDRKRLVVRARLEDVQRIEDGQSDQGE